MFIAALFIIAKTWKQPKSTLTDELSTDEWIKMWYVYTHTHTHTHTMEYYSATKKNTVMPFAATWLDLEIITLSEVRQRKTNIIWCHLYVESKKMV